MTRAGRVAAIDLGTRRIGVALSDRSATLASPWTVIERTPDAAAVWSALAAIVREEEVVHVIVGLPLQLSGAEGEAAKAARADAEALSALIDVPVELCDERLTTVTATRGQQGRGRRARKGRSTIDAEAAAVLLQSWLDGRQGREVNHG